MSERTADLECTVERDPASGEMVMIHRSVESPAASMLPAMLLAAAVLAIIFPVVKWREER